jgi:hypothetical protein
MADDPGTFSSRPDRPFLELRPLLRAFGMASDARKLVLASLGVALTVAGWSVAGWSGGIADRAPVALTLANFPAWVIPPAWPDLALRVLEPVRVLVLPGMTVFSPGVGWGTRLVGLLLALWILGVWGILGGAIVRIAVVEVATGSRIGVTTALRFALGKWGSLIGAPLTPLFAVAIFALGCAGFGLVYWIPLGIGSTIGAIFWFLPLLAGLVLGFILVGLAAGWPLMVATVAAENEDAPDALSRSYSYVNQRLARYALHALVAGAMGVAGLVVVSLFTRVVVNLATWGVELGSPADAGKIPLAWNVVIQILIRAWVYSFFWSSVAVIYLMLRRDVDGAEWYDVYLPEHDRDAFVEETPPAEPVEAAES